MTHFRDAELRQWSRSGPGADRDRVVAHVAACATCAAAYADAMRAASLAPIPVVEPDEVADFVKVGYQVPSRSADAGRSWRRRTLIALAAAAALIVAVTVPYLRDTREARDAITVRGDAIQALAPIGSVERGTEFRWSATAAAARYRLDIGDTTGVLFAVTTTATSARLPAAGGPALIPGTDYWWMVTALDATNREVASSGRQTFRIRVR